LTTPESVHRSHSSKINPLAMDPVSAKKIRIEKPDA
jgi:hypothetical protein